MASPGTHSTQSPLETEALIAACIDGDQTAKAIFYERYAPLISRAAQREIYRINPESPIEAADIAQEVFAFLFDRDCRALKSLFKPQSIDAWLMTVSQNRVRSAVRRQRTRLQPDHVAEERAIWDTPPSPRDQAERHERAEALEGGLKQLSIEERLILDLYYVHQKKYREIAALLGLNINTVASKIMRARQHLRNCTQEESHAEE